MPAHSSHILQPLDVACFGPLKRGYGTRVEGQARLGINHIVKDDFLSLYYVAHIQAITEKNIKASFEAAGLVPSNPERVLENIPRIPTPLPIHSPASLPSLTSKTPYTRVDVQRQVEIIKKRRPTTSRSSDSAFDRLVESCEIAI
jgi:hypothetical protein